MQNPKRKKRNRPQRPQGAVAIIKSLAYAMGQKAAKRGTLITANPFAIYATAMGLCGHASAQWQRGYWHAARSIPGATNAARKALNSNRVMAQNAAAKHYPLAYWAGHNAAKKCNFDNPFLGLHKGKSLAFDAGQIAAGNSKNGGQNA